MQLRLTFLDGPGPEARVWDALEDNQRAVVLEALARLVAKATLAPRLKDPDDE